MVNDDTIKTGQSLGLVRVLRWERKKARRRFVVLQISFLSLFPTLEDDLTAAGHEKKTQKEKKKKVGIDRRSPTRDVQRIERSPLYSFSFSRPQTYALFFLERERANRVSRWSQTRVDS